jgi:hypothetical protein
MAKLSREKGGFLAHYAHITSKNDVIEKKE